MAPQTGRPAGRKTNVTGQGSVQRKGSGLGTGPVGNKRPGNGGGKRSGGSKAPGGILGAIALLIMLFFGGNSFLGGGSNAPAPQPVQQTQQQTQQHTQQQTQSGPSTHASLPVQTYAGGANINSGVWSSESNIGIYNGNTAQGVPAKRTKIKGGGKDVNTVMIYMCATDLESGSGMATSDLGEMVRASHSDNVNIVVMTGGCRQWRTSGISNSVNQIYQVVEGGLKTLVKDAGKASMTDENNLLSFINYCKEEFPADRYDLILWDHGGGSIGGYGYDEKTNSKDTMTISEIDTALRKAKVDFDFIGFDACLMGTYETAITLAEYADYLIASEETEPGIGWYYTDWVTALSENPSIPTNELGKIVIDSFTDRCAMQLRGQKTTLSLVDLAELKTTVPALLTAFAESLNNQLLGGSYNYVSKVRSSVREFAVSNKIDQMDFIDFAVRIDNPEGEALVDALRGAVKYNRTNNMTNAYGISMYFPYRNNRLVNTALSLYDSIGTDAAYTRAVTTFAKQETTGQMAAGGYNNPYGALTGGSYQSSGHSSSGQGTGPSAHSSQGSYSTYNSGSSDLIFEILNQMLGGSGSSIDMGGMSGMDLSQLFRSPGSLISDEEAVRFAAANGFDASDLQLVKSGDDYVLHLTDAQWDLVTEVTQNLFVDDGQGYIDMGYDNLFSYNEAGDLVADLGGTWAAVNGQPFAYYLTETRVNEDGSYTFIGYMPVYYNDTRAELYVMFDENGIGEAMGIARVYENDETPLSAKLLTVEDPAEEGLLIAAPVAGDTLEPIAEYYTYDGEFIDTYRIGDAVIVGEDLLISNVELTNADLLVTYCITDVFNEHYWTNSIRP